MSGTDLEQQKKYLIRRAAQIALFARAQHSRRGRGIVVIGWPLPELLDPVEILNDSSYLPVDPSGLGTAADLARAVSQYNPTEQAVVMCIETVERSFNLHILTAIYGYAPRPVSSTNH